MYCTSSLYVHSFIRLKGFSHCILYWIVGKCSFIHLSLSAAVLKTYFSHKVLRDWDYSMLYMYDVRIELCEWRTTNHILHHRHSLFTLAHIQWNRSQLTAAPLLKKFFKHAFCSLWFSHNFPSDIELFSFRRTNISNSLDVIRNLMRYTIVFK